MIPLFSHFDMKNSLTLFRGESQAYLYLPVIFACKSLTLLGMNTIAYAKKTRKRTTFSLIH